MGDREMLLRRFIEEYKGDGEAGLRRAREEADTLLPRQCLTSDNGAALDPDPRFRCREWDLAEMTAYLVFFAELTNLTTEEAEGARAAAKSVRAGLRGGV
jgi:hypothetical protein